MRLPWFHRRFEEARRAMTTLVAVTVEDRSAGRAEEAIGRAFDEMERVAALLTRFDESSPVGVLNRDGRLGAPPAELRAVVGLGLELHRRSGGAFDPTVAPLVDLYQVHFTAHGGPPDAAEVREVKALVGADLVHLDDRSLCLGREGMALTLDGIGKGYVVDRMVEVLAAHDVRHAIVDAGGDIRALGGRADGRPWRVGVQDPRRPGELTEVLPLADAAVATSGDYVRFHDVERQYHHTVVPSTGRSPAAIASVSVRSATALEADALATAVFALGPVAGPAFAASVEGVSTLVLTRDGERRASPGWLAR
jgi:thiamine biosynthesis lipoprotein